MTSHTMLAFDADLREIASDIVAMAYKTNEQLVRATDALLSGNAALAREVRSGDDAIDVMQHEIEIKAIEIIATRQPLAIDLRKLSARCVSRLIWNELAIWLATLPNVRNRWGSNDL